MQVSKPLIAPSLLAANFLQLQSACDLIHQSEADWFHLDVMDGRFVPNISFGLPIVEQIGKIAQKPLDVHLMIEEPEKYVPAFAQAGASVITVHYEACTHLHRNIQQIKQLGLKAGVALNPHTPPEVLEYIMCDLDLILIMSVNPGFGGQTFIEETYRKLRATRAMCDRLNPSILIEVDGGVTEENAGKILDAGAQVLVAGSTVFKSASPVQTISNLKSASVVRIP